MPPISVLIKPASSRCNLRCEYCFYHDEAENRSVSDFGMMSLDTLEVIIRKVLRFASGQATFSFQGGEPTLRGLDFYRSVVSLQEKLNVNQARISNCLQSNGILIDTRWAQFLHDHNFLVGLSLDGPREVHDKHRVDGAGKETHRRVEQTSEIMDELKVDYNILFVVTGMSARRPDELYNYFKQRGHRFLQFMPCIDPWKDDRGMHKYSLTPERFTFFLKHFFNKWQNDLLGGRDVSIRYFDNLVRMVMGGQPEMCSLRGSCQCQFVFEADGGVYPCDFYVTDQWKLGHIQESELVELYESERCRHFKQSSLSTAKECKSCQWRRLCRGGCRRDRENPLTGDIERNYFCRSYSDFLSWAHPKLMDIARYVRKVNCQRESAPAPETQEKQGR